MQPSSSAPKPPERHVYKPSLRFLFDCLLVLNSFLFALAASRALPPDFLLSAGAGFNLFLMLSWFLVVRPLFEIVIENNAITGPFKVFKRQSILLRKVDLRRSLEYHRRAEFLGYRDLWSVDGERIRLYRRFLGKTRQYNIIKVIKEHPFHETAASQNKPAPASESPKG